MHDVRDSEVDASGDVGREVSTRRPWAIPRVLDHGSLRHFVRDISGADSDGSSMGIGGMMMFTMP